MALLLLANSLYAAMIPAGYSSWRDSEMPSKRAIEFGAEPSNYWNGNNWAANDPSFEPCSDGFRSIKNRHYVFVDTINDIVRFALSDPRGNVHILKSKIGPLYLSRANGSDTIFLCKPNLSGYRLSGASIEIPDIYPGVTCNICNRRSGMDHQFVFSPAADTLIDRIWRKAGSDTGALTINSIELFVDSLNLGPRDADGLWTFGHSREISGDLDLLNEDGINVLKMPQGHLEQGTRQVPLYRHIQRSGSRLRLCEGFRNSDIVGWPRFGFKHNDSRTWQASSVNTYISAFEPGTSFYTSTLLTVHTDSLAGVKELGLVWFDGLIDSLQGVVIIDSALLELQYCGDIIGAGTLRVCRGIADSSWYDSGCATWNASYQVGNDSIPWTGGWAVHTSSYTTVNSILRNSADTNSAGYYQFPCKAMIADIKSDGTDWGFWIDNGSGAGSHRASFSSGIKEGYAPLLYIQYRTILPGSRRLRTEK
jgi:hypothetical protein